MNQISFFFSISPLYSGVYFSGQEISYIVHTHKITLKTHESKNQKLRLVGTEIDTTQKPQKKRMVPQLTKKGTIIIKDYAAKTQGREVNPTGEGRDGKKQCPSIGLPRLLP